MFNQTVRKILEDFNIYPQQKFVSKSGPNINFSGPTPTGFLGGGLPGINPSSNQIVLKPKIKKKKIKKKSQH